MRPAGDIRHALLKAARHFKDQGVKPTLRELAQHAKVGIGEATQTVKNMRRAGALVPAGERRVAYRNRPVAVYDLPEATACAAAGGVELASVMRGWLA